ncbi:MAG TPA: ferritin-like domain-containing protein [Pyrinomonadaceae bacterium]|jgi:demethoxyubiquinone hydroxylase (CLK1/Coq7/Cat5 family)
MKNARQNLIRILQNAYSGELAAAYAYRGHWKSLKESPEKTQIKKIEAEEWAHRENVGKWLKELNAEPKKLREAIFWTIGRTLGASCYVSGWFFPMYFAGRLESGNVKEYEDAAAFASEMEMQKCVDELMDMAETEAEHEIFFRRTVAEHRLLPLMKTIFRWS